MSPSNFSLPYEVTYGAFNFTIGAILGQMMSRMPRVIYYGSRTLTYAQKNYSTIKKGLVAIVFALDKFLACLLFSKVIAFAYHIAL